MNSVNPNYKIGLYVRNSHAKQDTLEGTVKNQEERLRQYIRLRNMSGQFGEVVKVYVDRSLSAKNMHRPAVQQLLEDISAKRVTMVAVSELSRITRNMGDFGQFWELLQKQKCGFLSLRENVDTSNAAGEMVMYMLANIAQFERKQTGERVRENFKVRASRGLYNGGPLPLGYKLIPDKPGHLAIDEGQAEVVRKAFDYFLEYETLSRAAKALNQDGVKIEKRMRGGGGKTRVGFFTVDVLRTILRNKYYKGIREYKDGDETLEAKGAWSPIVETGKFDRVQEILKSNFRKRKPFVPTRRPYILAGITVCQTCGRSLSGANAQGKRKKYAYYTHGYANKKATTMAETPHRCDPNRVSADKLEEIVLANVRELAANEQMAGDYRGGEKDLSRG